LLAHLLVVDPSQRFSCEQVLEHPWMTQPAVGADGEAAAAPHLPRTAARIQDAITRRRSSRGSRGAGSLRQRISEASQRSAAVTPSITPSTDALRASAIAAAALPDSPKSRMVAAAASASSLASDSPKAPAA
jgi:calcium/calmodulin-dependent protein kinase I